MLFENLFRWGKKEPALPAVEEKELVDPSREAAEGGPRPEQSSERASEKYAAILSRVGTSQESVLDQESVAADASYVGQALDAENQVRRLVELSKMKGVPHAVAAARELKNYFVLDALHDELVADKLYQELLREGLIQSE
jgi:hypothetical protein